MPAMFAIYSRRQLYLRFFAFLESFGQKFGWAFVVAVGVSSSSSSSSLANPK